jgi:4-diphosphocytidyl-2-C-methyl-D-erythritol kinase
VSARPARVRIEARAKLNLGLAVGPRRADGFHDLATVFQSISLADTLTIERRARGFSLAIRWEDASVRRGTGGGRPSRRGSAARVPAGRDNLVLRAARLLAGRYGLRGGAHFDLIKRIPAGAGLGGGSADAAAALSGLARLHGLRLDAGARLALAAELGSDVPFALYGGTALGLGRGERLRRLRLASPFRAVVTLPEWRISTAAAFRALDRRKLGLTGWRSKLRFAQSIGREAIRPRLAMRLGNSFEEVPGKHRSEFQALCGRMRAAGIEAPHLTGSGSAVFGVLRAGVPEKQFVKRFAGSESVFLVRSSARGLTHKTLP